MYEESRNQGIQVASTNKKSCGGNLLQPKINVTQTQSFLYKI